MKEPNPFALQRRSVTLRGMANDDVGFGATASGAAAEPLTLDQVNDALIHLAELAVAFAGGGIEFVELPNADTPPTAMMTAPDPAALACLTKVARLLLDHQRQQRDDQVADVGIDVRNALAKVYAKAKAAPDVVDLDTEVTVALKALGFDPDERDLDELVPGALEIRGSPADFAASVVAPHLGIKSRQYYNRQKGRNHLAIRRLAFGRWVPLKLAQRYCGALFDEAIVRRKREGAPRVFDAWNQAAPFIAMLERRSEDEYRRVIAGMYRALFFEKIDTDGAPEWGRAQLEEIVTFVQQAWNAVRVATVQRRKTAGESADEAAVAAEADTVLREHVEKLIAREIQKLGLA